LPADAALRVGFGRVGTGIDLSSRSVYGCAGEVQVVGRRDLADLAEVHHAHAVADVLHDGEVVRDEDHGEAVPGLHVLEQVEDLRLHRHVEWRRARRR
jgi:hypothetical protein